VSFPYRHYVQIKVKDVNEFSPEWTNAKEDDSPLKVTVQEGQPAGAVVADVLAEDADGSDVAGRICSYRLKEEDEQAFEINDKGK